MKRRNFLKGFAAAVAVVSVAPVAIANAVSREEAISSYEYLKRKGLLSRVFPDKLVSLRRNGKIVGTCFTCKTVEIDGRSYYVYTSKERIFHRFKLHIND